MTIAADQLGLAIEPSRTGQIGTLLDYFQSQMIEKHMLVTKTSTMKHGKDEKSTRRELEYQRRHKSPVIKAPKQTNL